MEEDSGVKAAPVSRLRRRLSVDLAEETKSPAAPSTPTKKGRRLAAKPQLELIDENAPQNSPKRTTRKSIARDLVEPEEKPLTPARRSTRIKSNTSIVSETVQSVDSPRAKRAAVRRTSQIGSDNEAPVTPARTRRARAASTSSLDNQTTPNTAIEATATPGRTRRIRKNSTTDLAETTPASKPALITEVIVEEVETGRKPTTNTETSEETAQEQQNVSPNNQRKSLRLAKKSKTPDRPDKTDDNDITEKPDDISMKSKSIAKSSLMKESDSPNKLLECFVNLQNIKVKTSKLNKSTSAIGELATNENRRHRTKSWTTLSGTPSKENHIYSDNESTKKKLRESNQAGSGDGLSKSFTDTKHEKIENTEHVLNGSSNKKRSDNSFSIDCEKESVTPSKSGTHSISFNETPKPANTSTESNKENLLGVNQKSHTSSATDILFSKAPSGELQTLIFIDDSESNSENMTQRSNTDKQLDGDDQCVPVVNHKFEQDIALSRPDQSLTNVNIQNFESVSNKTEIENDFCEPMDIDETMPENCLIADLSGENNLEVIVDKTQKKGSRKSSLCVPQEAEITKDISSNSKRKSSLSSSQDLDTTIKSLVTQIKHISSAETLNGSHNEILSKSVNTPDIAKNEMKKKNIASNCLTSTPVQQKDVQQFNMQMNTSAIKPNNVSKKKLEESKNDVSLISKKAKTLSKSNLTEDESDEKSPDSSNMMDDEAKDAGDDYESGDSRDDEDILYEKQNEIPVGGETLTSDDDDNLSDDDYEKDSFVVTSDEEDKDLLSGSGDDLDMSDNELTMSAKSKKKFDDRKVREQKKASREMFEARHKLNESANSSKKETSNSNKSRLRFDSTLLESGDDDKRNKVPSKKNKRLRIDSSHDASDQLAAETTISQNIQESEEIGYKKKKSKRLSESICNESAMNEKEITICNQSQMEKEDPLICQVKMELKTPQKDFNISTIHFTDREEVEQIDVNENASMMNPNESLDPLQATRAQDEDSDSISENEEITKNYDSILNELNKKNKFKQIKSCDISLDLNKKTQHKVKEPIVEQLNLTQTRKSKTKKSKVMDSDTDKSKKKENVVDKVSNCEDESSSDSIDLKLLFSDDSNGSNMDRKSEKEVNENDRYIPLKRTEAKTDITMMMDEIAKPGDESLLNTSTKKNKNRQSEQTDETHNQSVSKDHSLLNTSNKKKNKNRKSSQNELVMQTDETQKAGDVSLLNTSTKKQKHRKSSQNYEALLIEDESLLDTSSKKSKKKSSHNEEVLPVDEMQKPADESLLNSSTKKKNRKSSHNEEVLANDEIQKPADESLLNISTNNKKKNRKPSHNDEVLPIDEIKEPADESMLNTSTKNKKRNRMSSHNEQVSNEVEEDGFKFFIDTTGTRVEETTVNTSLNISTSKKKNKHSISFAENIEPVAVIGVTVTDNPDNDAPTEVSYRSDKKMKRLSQSHSEDTSGNDVPDGVQLNVPIGSIKKNKHKTLTSSANIDDINIGLTDTQEETVTSSKKRKRKSSGNIANEESESVEQTKALDEAKLLNVSSTENQKKKRKMSQNNEDNTAAEQDAIVSQGSNLGTQELSNAEQPSKSKKKKDKKFKSVEHQKIKVEPEVQSTTVNKKRKKRDDDDGNKKSKVLKEHSFDKIHVPRLPPTVISQLDDKPRKELIEMKKAKVVSTTEFLMDEPRRMKNKPSNYLEESVYLNNDSKSPVVVKQKTNFKKPKVLPFIPTASTSASGFTTNFKVKVLPQKIEFVAQKSDALNFKNDYLDKKRVKKLRTFELYKNHRSIKSSKF